VTNGRIPPTAPLLAVRGLSAGYGRLPVLRDVSLDVADGEFVAILGANGAGKSTLLRTISGYLTTITAGSIAFAGTDVAKMPLERGVRIGLQHVPEGRHLFTELTVDDNLRLGGYTLARRDVAATMDALYARFPSLAARRKAVAFALSGGEQQMLAIARAMMAKPRLLMLDEPSTGLAPKIVDQIFGIIAELKAAGTAVLLVEQNAHLTLKHADRAYVFEGGTIALSGAASTLANDERVQAIYLGGHA
jgi:branched-chain amino acid transport system ATP-binding protein